MRIPSTLTDQVIDDNMAGVVAVCDFVLANMSEMSNSWEPEDESLLLEAYALISSLSEIGQLEVSTSDLIIDGSLEMNCLQLHSFIEKTRRELGERVRKTSNQRKLEQFKAHYAVTISTGFAYEFTDGDIGRVQTIINELRDLLAKDCGLEEGHKRRLLKRLEELQKELHKKVSDLNKFYGLMGDFGVAIGKLGADAKPFTDRIGEVLNIAWKSQARAEELPSNAGNPLLGNGGEPPAIG